MKHSIIILLIILISMTSFTVVFADEVLDAAGKDEVLIASSDDNEPQLFNSDGERVFKTSRRYSAQIFFVLLIFIALYRIYKWIKYRR